MKTTIALLLAFLAGCGAGDAGPSAGPEQNGASSGTADGSAASSGGSGSGAPDMPMVIAHTDQVVNMAVVGDVLFYQDTTGPMASDSQLYQVKTDGSSNQKIGQQWCNTMLGGPDDALCADHSLFTVAPGQQPVEVNALFASSDEDSNGAYWTASNASGRYVATWGFLGSHLFAVSKDTHGVYQADELEQDFNRIYGFAADADGLWVLENSSGEQVGSPRFSQIHRVDPTGKVTYPDLPATGLLPDSTLMLAVTATNVFWLDTKANTLSTMKKDGTGIAVVHDVATNVGALIADAEHVYWSSDKGVFRANADGTHVTTLVPDAVDATLTLDATHLYVYDDATKTITRMPK